jgi:preprotein translocase subunit SecE
LKDVRTEFGKISWPKRNDLAGSTAVVIVISIAMAIFVGIVDLLLSQLLALFLR